MFGDMRIDNNYRTHGETEGEACNRAITCRCGAKDWRVFKRNILPPWGREIVCQKCSHTELIGIIDPNAPQEDNPPP